MNSTVFKNSIIFIFSVLLGVFCIWGDYQPEKQNNQKISGAKKALEFWTHSRAFPNKDIPSNKHYSEFKKTQQRISKASFHLSSSDQWESMGPHNVPGRMISLHVNPQNTKTLYAGSATGGLWRTFNSTTGKGWHRVKTGFPVLGVMAIAIDPLDSNNIYIGTGEVYGYNQSAGGIVIRTTRGSYGMGILKSSDGGETWEKSLDWTYQQQKGVQCIRLNFSNPSELYAATTDGVYKSVDAGETWEMVLDVIMAVDIVIHEDDPNKVMVSCGNLGSPEAGLYKTDDAGDTWMKISGIPNFTGKTLLDYSRSNPDIVFASVADSLMGKGLYRTEDFGNNWIKTHNTDVPRYQGFFAHWVAVHPTNAQNVVHAGVDIYKSTNGGNSVSVKGKNVHVDHHNFTHDWLDPNLLYIACDGGVYRSTDFGTTYTDIGYGLQTAQFYNGFNSSYQDSNLALGGLQDNNTVIYRGDYDWDRVIGGDGCWSAINSKNDNILYGSAQYNWIRKSKNKGFSFTDATSGLPTWGVGAFISPYVCSESEPDILYAGYDRVYRTTNAAGLWARRGPVLDGNFIISMAIYPKDSKYVMVATAPTKVRASLFYSSDGGNEWIEKSDGLPNRYPMDVAFNPVDPDIIYAVFSGYGSGHVFKSTNAGENWTDITGVLPDVPTLAIVVDPTNTDHVYVGNDLGVYFSADGGQNWLSFQEGLPEAVMAMDLNISRSNKKLRVATHGNGAYQRNLVSNITDIKEINQISDFKLHQNYPNPFNPATTIKFTLPKSDNIKLTVFDNLGQIVQTLVDDFKTSGVYEVNFNAANLASGIYFYQLTSTNFSSAKKMMLVK